VGIQSVHVAPDDRGRSSVAQGLTGLEHVRERCTIRQVEEFRVSDKSGDCCQIPQRKSRDRFLREKPERVTKTDGRGTTFPWIHVRSADRE
jgi:hypothetical protein